MILIHKYPKCSHQEQQEELFSLVSNDKARKNGFNLELRIWFKEQGEKAVLEEKINWGLPPTSKKEKNGHLLGIFQSKFC